ncbi:PREDICTED: TIR domain-containing adapter molecule 1 [Condylura cristata]|uniref:TIR domain-containing adapter molecule 1 n=1 Tax=Condylura cristata TaxID=143302 RepID=UPI0003343060|nr:PREDICTED: TIR domain-containing adapter molecule 1 [Condylura cristata]XP_012584955.1 PREDICTED: TIR domain-containing adapter molecule 1 [Condylura cristata]
MASEEPSLAGAFAILEAAGRDKLLHLKHKLKTVRLGCPRVGLLHAMVLLKLGQETEARISLDAQKTDSVAQFVARQWAGVDSAGASEEPSELPWATAQVYQLLAEEELCAASTRDRAYQAALRVLSARDDRQLRALQEEALQRFGWDLDSGQWGFQPLRSDLGRLPPSSASPSRTRSLPQPIEGLSGWSRGHSLKSTDNPASVASGLEISQSPTMPLLSLPHRSPGPSKLCVEPQPSVEPRPVCQHPEEMSWPSRLEPATSQAPPSSPPPGPPEVPPAASLVGPSDTLQTSPPYSVVCTEAPESLPSPSRSASSVADQTPLQGPVEDSTCRAAPPRPPAPQAQVPPPCSPSPAPSSAPPAPPEPCAPTSKVESQGQKFYNFVVLHARADEHVALRVREKLEGLGVSDGATFCEEFQVPGRGQLHCLQDALQHSAFTILLLTPNFDCHLSRYQVNQSVVSSLLRHDWHDSVIPFLPEESAQDQLSPKACGLLKGMVWLDESSPVFHRKVANTFKPQQLQRRRELWKREQDAQALREQRQRLEQERQHVGALSSAYAAYARSQQALQAQVEQLRAALANVLPPGAQGPAAPHVPPGGPSPFPTWPGPLPPLTPSWPAGIPPPPAAQEPPTFSQPPLVPPQSPGLQPLIIHHAQMVQLGLNNHMWNQRGAPETEDSTREAE